MLCAAAILCGCTSSLNFDDLSSGPDVEDPGIVADAAMPDAIATDAGSVDGGVTAVDPATFSCASITPPATFCDDFEGEVPEDVWSDVVIAPMTPMPAGAIRQDTRDRRAGTRSLLAVAQEGIGPSSWFSIAAVQTFPRLLQPARLTSEFDMKIEQIDPRPDQLAMAFQLIFGTQAEGYNQFTLQLESRGVDVSTRFVQNDYPASDSEVDPRSEFGQPSSSPAINQWVHVTFRLEATNPAGGGNRAFLQIDDRVLFDGPLAYDLRPLTPQIEIGVPWVDSTQITEQDRSRAWRVRFDNFLVRIDPR